MDRMYVDGDLKIFRKTLRFVVPHYNKQYLYMKSYYHFIYSDKNIGRIIPIQ